MGCQRLRHALGQVQTQAVAEVEADLDDPRSRLALVVQVQGDTKRTPVAACQGASKEAAPSGSLAYRPVSGGPSET